MRTALEIADLIERSQFSVPLSTEELNFVAKVLRQSTRPEAAPKLSEIVYVAVSRALDEANIRNEVLRGMCIEVALETLPEPQSSE